MLSSTIDGIYISSVFRLEEVGGGGEQPVTRSLALLAYQRDKIILLKLNTIIFDRDTYFL